MIYSQFSGQDNPIVRNKLIIMNRKSFNLIVFTIISVITCSLLCQTSIAGSQDLSRWKPDKYRQRQGSLPPPKKTKADDPVWTSIVREQQSAPVDPLSLVQLFDVALSNNPSTKKAWENERKAQAERKQAQSEWYPQVTVSGKATYDNETTSPKAYEVNQLSYGPQGDLTYLLFDFGGRNARVKEAYQNLVASNFQYKQTLQDVVLETATAYYGLYSAQSDLESAEADVRDSNVTLEAARQKYKVGLVSKLDLLQAESNHDDVMYSYEDTKGQLKDATAQLAKALGYPADTSIKIKVPRQRIPTDISEDDISLLIQDAIDRRADLEAYRAGLKAKEFAVKAANSDLWPSVSAGGSLGVNWYEYYDNKTGKRYDFGYEGYLSVDWDIFDGFYNLNKKRALQAEVSAGRASLMLAELEASLDVWMRFYDYRTAVKKLVYSEAFLTKTAEAYDLARESYTVGLMSMVDLLQSQSELSDARSRLIQTKKDLFVALANLAYATGSFQIKKDNGGFVVTDTRRLVF